MSPLVEVCGLSPHEPSETRNHVVLLRGHSRGASKRLNCARFVLLNVEDPVQTRHPEKVHQRLMNVYELQLTTLLAKCCVSSDQLSDARSVYVADFIQIQNDPLIPSLY